MINHIKLKIALPVLVAALSTTAFAANDMHASLSESGSNNLVASLSPNSSKARPDSSRAAKDDGGSIGIDAKAKNINNSVQDMASQQANSNDTCMGSKSTGMQLPIVGGISFGSSWTDKNCMMIKNSRELWNMGFKTAALARMCMDDGNREALESTGTPCPSRRTESPSRKTEAPSLTYLQ